MGEGSAVTDGVTLVFDPTLCDVSVTVGDFRPNEDVYFLDLRLKEGVTSLEIAVRVAE